MKILLVANYPNLGSQSMDRFAMVLDDGLRAIGHQVRLIKPKPCFGRMLSSATGLGKWLGYLDRFLIFRQKLKQAAKWADVVHICDQANAVYTPMLHHIPHLITCHDMLAIRSAFGEFTEHATSSIGKIYQQWILFCLKQARHVVCVSKSTYSDVLRLTGICPSKISLIKNGFNYHYQQMRKEESKYHLEKMGLNELQPFFLHVGGNYWYKNKRGLLRIFKELIKLSESRPIKLILAGQRLDNSLKTYANKIKLSDKIIETGEVTNRQLNALYSSAEGLIFPSLAEGFGWPIIEAQACGCRVFTSDLLPMTEIGGSAAVYFDANDEIGAAKIIWDTIQNSYIAQASGHQNAKVYSTMEMIYSYADCYRLVRQFDPIF